MKTAKEKIELGLTWVSDMRGTTTGMGRFKVLLEDLRDNHLNDLDELDEILPDPYANKFDELNIKRIKAYKNLEQLYNIDSSTVADLFCKGIDWYKEQCQRFILSKKKK